MTRYWLTLQLPNGEIIRRGPVSGWEEVWHRWPFLPSNARLVAENGAEVAPALPEPLPEPLASSSAPSLAPAEPPPEAFPEGLTRGQRLWRERMAKKGKA